MKAFNIWLQNFADKSSKSTQEVVKTVATQAFKEIMLRTPVAAIRGGRARAGWSAAGSALGFPVPASMYSSKNDSDFKSHESKTEVSYTAINNVRYIIYLEYGWSKQAPLGMVRITLLSISQGHKLPKALQANYTRLWTGMGRERYAMQKAVFEEGLSLINTGTSTGRLDSILSAIRASRASRTP